MPINSSWPEWIACLAGAAAAVIAFRGERRWIALGLAVLMAAWFCGTAKGLLLPAVFGNLALLLAPNTRGRWRRAGLILALGGSVARSIRHSMPGPTKMDFSWAMTIRQVRFCFLTGKCLAG